MNFVPATPREEIAAVRSEKLSFETASNHYLCPSLSSQDFHWYAYLL
jgi:hypothetical protein